MFRSLLPGIVLLSASSLLPAFDIVPFTANYRFNIDNKLSGTATRTLEKTGADWRYTFSASAPLATATETSNFRFDGRTVTSLAYEQRRKIFISNKKSSVSFDWKAMKATGKRDKKTVQYAIKPGTLDALNMEIQMRRDLKDLGKLDGPYSMSTPKDISPLSFVIESEEVLDTAMGKLSTLKVSRQHNDPNRHTSFWLAKDFDYLPAKVVQNDDGAVYTIELTGYKPAKPSTSSK